MLSEVVAGVVVAVVVAGTAVLVTQGTTNLPHVVDADVVAAAVVIAAAVAVTRIIK